MSKNLKLDEVSHDIIIGRGAVRVTGAAQVAQLVKCRLLTILGEWDQNVNLGLPWFDAIFTKQVRAADIQAAVANIIRGTSGVRQLIDLSIDPDYRTRELGITFTAISIYGDISEFVSWQASSTV